MSDNILDMSVKNVALKILIIIVVILTFMYGSYYILKLYNDYSETKTSKETLYDPLQEMQVSPIIQEESIMQYDSIMQEESITYESPVISETDETLINKNPIKTVYNKYEDINGPSSYDSATGGYISAQDVCFLHKSGERSYTSKRPKCMACQVDLTNNGKTKHNNTNTNIIKSCPYSFDGSNNTNTKDKCIEICKKYKDE
jgi:hypothetical protein